MENRAKLMVSGVTDVISYDDSEIRLATGEGELCVAGEGLEIVDFSRETCQLDMTGHICELLYSDCKKEPKGLFSRLMR